MYDWEKPSLASRAIILGRVKASARNSVSGCLARTSAIIHSQNGSGLVCGLSTRKMRTPWSAQNITTSRSACQRCSPAGGGA
ncbi:hypothetical protein D3C86_1721510 [compost metagenome]